jgi:hypothetical protein
MTHRKPHGVSNLVSFTCATCDRVYIVSAAEPAATPDDAPECKCGRAMTASQLAPGMYELSSVVQARPVSSGREPALSDAGQPIAREADLGYGASHGYSPTHGGPTGPGDAPAAEAVPASSHDNDDKA